MKTIKYFIVVLVLALQSQSVSAQDTKIGILNAIQAYLIRMLLGWSNKSLNRNLLKMSKGQMS